MTPPDGKPREVAFLRREARRKIGTAGRSSEQAVAKRLGARLTPASGAIVGAKGDMTLGTFLIEAKSTQGDSLGLKFDWLAKISREAREVGKTPALTVTFTNSFGKFIMDGRWVLIPERLFDDMLKEEPP